MWPPWIQYCTHLSHLLTVVSTSTSFYIYWMKHYKGNILQVHQTCLSPYPHAEDLMTVCKKETNKCIPRRTGGGSQRRRFKERSIGILQVRLLLVIIDKSV